MAAALFNRLANPQCAHAISAGTEPASVVHPVVIDALREVDIDLTGVRPQRLTEQMAAGASMLVTMGCGDRCPVIPGAIRDDWPLADPKDRPLGEVRAIRDDIRRRIERLLEARGWTR
jgi:arsenate reductase